MKKANVRKIFAVLLSLTLIAVIAFTMSACTGEKTKQDTTAATQNTTSASDKPVPHTEKTVEPVVPETVGDGQTTFMFSVTHKDGSVKAFEVSTDEKTVGEALLKLEIIAGDDGDYGLYVKTVDGETVDYDKDGMYWAFYENGEYAQKGVDQTEIKNGVSYELKASK